MRALGYFSLDDLSYAIFESNGKLSPMENVKREEKPTSLPLLVIDDGKIIKENLSVIKSTQSKITEFIERQGAKLKNTEVLTIDGNGRAYFKQKKQKYKILEFALSEGIKW